MSKTGKIIAWVIVAILVVWGLASLNKKSTENSSNVIKVGFLGPMTGEIANMGENAQAAVSIAVDEINKSGGVLGKKLEMVYEDDMCTGAGAANAVSKLINTDKVVAVVGGVCSGASLGAAPISEASKTTQIAYCSTSPLLTNSGDYIFRDVPSDLFQGKYAAEYLMKEGKTKVSVLTAKNDWGDGLNKSFTDAFTKLGGKILSSDTFDPNTKDLKTQMTEIKSKNPDAVYFISYTDQSIAGLKQAHDLGIKAQFFGADAWDDTKVWSELGKIGDGAMYTVVGTNSNDQFKQAMKEKLGKDDLIYCSNYAYDATKIVAEAINRAGSTDKTAIKDAMYKTDYKGGVSAKEIKFDENGDPASANYVVKIVKDGKPVELSK